MARWRMNRLRRLHQRATPEGLAFQEHRHGSGSSVEICSFPSSDSRNDRKLGIASFACSDVALLRPTDGLRRCHAGIWRTENPSLSYSPWIKLTFWPIAFSESADSACSHFVDRRDKHIARSTTQIKKKRWARIGRRDRTGAFSAGMRSLRSSRFSLRLGRRTGMLPFHPACRQ
jgi:hypothetical protein